MNSANVRLAASFLSGSGVKVCAVVGFPLGAGTPASKAFEAREAVRCGADEIDMVLNIGALKSHDYALVTEDIVKVVKAVPGKIVKVILETGMLTEEGKSGCLLALQSGERCVRENIDRVWSGRCNRRRHRAHASDGGTRCRRESLWRGPVV